VHIWGGGGCKVVKPPVQHARDLEPAESSAEKLLLRLSCSCTTSGPVHCIGPMHRILHCRNGSVSSFFVTRNIGFESRPGSLYNIFLQIPFAGVSTWTRRLMNLESGEDSEGSGCGLIVVLSRCFPGWTGGGSETHGNPLSR
jgi:hypothetical protein